MIQLGDRVRDTVSGLEGLALARMEAIYEATQFRVHREILNPHDGNVYAGEWIDAGRLIVVAGTPHTIAGFGVKR